MIKMFQSHKRKLKQEYQNIDFEIYCYNRGKWNTYYFLRHILCFLRQDPSLCMQNDYKLLYDETIVFLILHAHVNSSWRKNNPQTQQKIIELLTDLEKKYQGSNYENFTIETITHYLQYRKESWMNGKTYTKEKFGFIT